MRNQMEMMHRNFMPQNTFVQQGGGAIFNTGHPFPAQLPGTQAPGPFPTQHGQTFRQNTAHQFSNHPSNQFSQGGSFPPTNTVQPGASLDSIAQNPQSTPQSDLPRGMMGNIPGPGQPGDVNGATAGNPLQVPPPTSDPTSTSERQGHLPPGHASTTQNGPIPNHTTVQETVGPNGERMRTVISNQTFNIQMQTRTATPPFQRSGNSPHPNTSRSGTPNRPAETVANGPPNVAPQYRPNPVFFNPMMNGTGPSGLPPPPMFPPFPMANGGLPVPFMGQQPAMVPQTNSTTTAWLLNGPGGPQGFLLSPTHGFFSTPPTTSSVNSRVAAMRPFMHSRRVRPHTHQTQTHAQNQAQPQQPAAAIPAQNANPNVPIQAPLVQPQNLEQQQQQAEAEQRNLMQLAFRRIWLFVRLYLFTFVLGGNRGWMRWFWLAVTILWCVMPETTIFQDLGRRVQRHVENLLPLAPHPHQRQNNGNQQQTQDDNADQQRDNSTGTSDASATGSNSTQQQQRGLSSGRPRTPTPSEAADRLRRDHRARQVNWFSDLVTRIESGLALFLASLIPGLPERHIEARNELAAAERLIEEERRAREERERALREEQEREQGQVSSSGGGGAEGSGSGGVGTRTADEGGESGDRNRDGNDNGGGSDHSETNRAGAGEPDPNMRRVVKAMSSALDADPGGEGSAGVRQRSTTEATEARGDV